MHGGKPAFGTIQADGSFVLTTERTDDGAVPGKHRVTVVGDLKIQGKEVHMTFLAPREFSVEVVPDKKNDLLVNISQDDGWQETADD